MNRTILCAALRFAALPLLLASCAPTAQRSPAVVTRANFQAPCNTALSAVREAALHTRPVSSASWINSWTLLSVESWSDTEVKLSSRNTRRPVTYAVFDTFERVVNTAVTCTEVGGAAVLTLTSRGQTELALQQLHAQLLRNIRLP